MNPWINRTRREFPGLYQTMHWLSAGAARAAEQYREELLGRIFDQQDAKAGWAFEGTKLFAHGMSPGCALCGQGKWSCLFINGICNAGCFYCPAPQKEPGVPITSSVEFDQPRDYADYVKRFDIQGVGFSGGEPLMTLDRVVAFLKALGEQVKSPLHTWMYTNGILASSDRLKALRDNGLKEIRFDLSAVDYHLNSLKKAVGIIPIVTVEIPAIPEDLEKTKPLLKVLADTGVNFLNLHQIRCTPFNTPKLINRGYTFLHGPGTAVLETELTALSLVLHALEEQILLPVNYCSFTFRNQFQKAAARRRNGSMVAYPWEDITQPGYIRTMEFCGDPGLVQTLCDGFEKKGKKETDWHVSEKRDRVAVSQRLWPHGDLSGLTLKLTYNAAALRPSASLRYPHAVVCLNPDKEVVIERDNRHPGIMLEAEQIPAFAETFLGQNGGPASQTQPLPEDMEARIRDFEAFCPGLSPYI